MKASSSVVLAIPQSLKDSKERKKTGKRRGAAWCGNQFQAVGDVLEREKGTYSRRGKYSFPILRLLLDFNCEVRDQHEWERVKMMR
jgi:hypothetical protein